MEHELLTEQEKRKIAKERMRQRIIESQDRLINSQLTLALGNQWLYRIDIRDDGTRSRPQLVQDQEEIERYLTHMYDPQQAEYYFIATDKPDNRAIDSLLDRLHGKPQTPTNTEEDAPTDQGVILYPTALMESPPDINIDEYDQSLLEAPPETSTSTVS